MGYQWKVAGTSRGLRAGQQTSAVKSSLEHDKSEEDVRGLREGMCVCVCVHVYSVYMYYSLYYQD